MVLRLPLLRMPSRPSLPTSRPPPTTGALRSRRSGLGGLGQSLGRDQHRGLDVGGLRRPRQLANREPEPVGRRQNDLLAGNLDPDAGEHRQRVVTAGGNGDLADRLGEQISGDHAGLVGQGRQRRVVLDGHRRQRESCAAAGQRHAGALDADVDRLGRQRPGDVRQQPSGYQNASRRSDFGRNLNLGRDFVVESGDRQTVVGAGEQAHRPAPARSAGWAGLRATQATASAKSSRTRRNFKSVRPTVVVATSIESLRSIPTTSAKQRFPDVSHTPRNDASGRP